MAGLESASHQVERVRKLVLHLLDSPAPMVEEILKGMAPATAATPAAKRIV